ncbi:MAG TPA: type II CAAX endopeptidase family protein [Gemmatimonadales bacterium]|nr:type II CAAX endopeptidase family protein [Gemmatimonadales bacterium]
MIGFYLLAIGVTAVALWLLPRPRVSGPMGAFAATPAMTLGAVLATVAAAWRAGDPSAAGWYGFGPAGGGLARGIGVGGCMVAGTLALSVAAGARWAVSGQGAGAYAGTLAVVLTGIALAALAEELLFRGFPLATLAGAFGTVPAVVGLSVVFALLHAGNPETTPLGLVNILLASVVLSAAFFARGALAGAWGLHASWNGGLVVADAPVSGVAFNLPGLDFGGGAVWVTGGRFGPEGGMAATAALVGGLAWLMRQHRAAAKQAVGPRVAAS